MKADTSTRINSMIHHNKIVKNCWTNCTAKVGEIFLHYTTYEGNL